MPRKNRLIQTTTWDNNPCIRLYYRRGVTSRLAVFQSFLSYGWVIGTRGKNHFKCKTITDPQHFPAFQAVIAGTMPLFVFADYLEDHQLDLPPRALEILRQPYEVVT